MQNISKTLTSIVAGINVTSKRSDDTNNLIIGVSEEIDDIAGTMTELINTLGELSAEGSEITSSLGGLRALTAAVKTGYSEMLPMTDTLRNDMNGMKSLECSLAFSFRRRIIKRGL